VYCRRSDVDLVRAVVGSAASRYEKDMKHKVTVNIDGQSYLSEEIAGGVELAANEGRIRCVNTLDSRLEQLQTAMLPEIRTMLFGVNESRAFYH